ncbi:NADH dehydrogenase subunit M [Sediminihabitans luteus]|uniref:NADH dehydrogenase subunit M n=1 Tax=Sediminihabitans luteus TaxID=1138585 RepID=A0A2M9CZF8_9CELL|nr:NADH-quinone oxidoreductase subunit M [Sediminihabitans luteus]PJJ77324.1 NADH dehydrogenase subunit M [Sediminihabitans luteus]GII98775.1 NADH-quinone oxidoreductase subunit M [Sediminihabitans luteus]
MIDLPWLTTLVVVPFVGALVVWGLGATRARTRVRGVALAFSLVEVVVLVAAITQFDTSRAQEFQLAETASWIPSIGASWALGVDGVSLLLVALAVGLVPLVIGAAWKENLTPDGGLGRTGTYLVLVLLLEAFMVTVFAARDVFLFYVVFEAMLIPVYFMIGGFGQGARRRYAAVKFLMFSLAGGLVMLAAVIALYLQGPGGDQGFLTDNLTGLALDETTGRLLFCGFFLAFAIKAPLFPVHSWLPDAAQSAPAGTSALLVGVLDKVGTFGMLTLCLPLFPEASRWAAPVVLVLAVVSILYGAIMAIGQSDIMRLVAFTSVSHFGFIVLGIFAFTSLSVTGSSLYMLNHGISTGALFLLAGFLVARHPRRSQRIADYGGMQKVAPVLAGTFLVAGLSALSLPGLSTFVSEIMVFLGTFARHEPLALVATLGVVLAALYVLLTYQKVFTGAVPEGLETLPDLGHRERWVVAPLVAGLLVLGLYPAPALDVLRDPAQQTLTAVGVEDVAVDLPAAGPDETTSDDTTATHDGSDQ